MLHTLEQQEAMAVSGSGPAQRFILKEEDSVSPNTLVSVESASPATSSAKKNGGKRIRKS